MALSKAGKFLRGCAIGCGVFMVIGIGSCVGFVVWLNQSGDLVDTDLLVSHDATGYAEWQLSLDDPGTEVMVGSVLETLARVRNDMKTNLPPTLDMLLKSWQSRRDAKKIRELFPLVVAWSMGPGDHGESHQLTLSVERLGNRMVLIDWILGLTLARGDDVRVVRHGVENIYQIGSEGAAFFMRKSDVVFSNSLASAEQLVDRLGSGQRSNPSELTQLLAELPPQYPLRAAVTNHNGELQRLAANLAHLQSRQALRELDLSNAANLVLYGGFTDERAFAMTMTLERRHGVWTADATERAAEIVAQALGGAENGVFATGRSADSHLDIDVRIPDLPAKLEGLVDRIKDSVVMAPENGSGGAEAPE